MSVALQMRPSAAMCSRLERTHTMPATKGSKELEVSTTARLKIYVAALNGKESARGRVRKE
eukprot:1140536-Pelagomonas_calceolata.AAC.1